MSATPCRVTADLAEHERRAEENHARWNDAQVRARDELYSDESKFLEAITDMGDTLAYSVMSDKELDNWTFGRSAKQKRAVAQKALAAMQTVADKRRRKKPLTDAEAAIADLLNFEAEHWLTERAESIYGRAA